MRPTRNRFVCPACGRPKMRFDSLDEARRFLSFNADSVERESGKRPVRAYYCCDCCAWHVTSRRHSSSRPSIIYRYGLEEGVKIADQVERLKSRCRNSEEGLLRKIRELHRMLKFEHIEEERCHDTIRGLMADFELVLRGGFGEPTYVDKLFGKFEKLCATFFAKQQAGPCLAQASA